MIELQRGDKLPFVALIQALLNSRPGTKIPVDADFGRKTEERVKQFQYSTRQTVSSGRVDDITFNSLKGQNNLSVVDVIDICHPQIISILEADLVYNPNPVVLGCMSNAVIPTINKIIIDNKPGSVVLLRFVGHGSMGLQAVGLGRGWQEIMGTDKGRKLNAWEDEMYKNVFRYSSIGGSKSKAVGYVKECMKSIAPVFSPYGCIEFHGCHIADGLNGREFVREIAEITGVPVTAGISGQSMSKMPRYCGETYSAFPNGINIRDWANKLPELNIV